MVGQSVCGRIITCVAIAGLLVGCGQKPKQRITMLEQANRNLTERLNLTRGELEQSETARQELDRMLLASQQDNDELRARPIPQATLQEAAPGWTPVAGGAMIAIEGNILFIAGKTTLRDQARRTLDAISSTIQSQYADKDILVIGHTDDQPIKKSGWTDNYQLSTERALSVTRYLRDHGVPPSRIIACGSGEHRPRASGNTNQARSANRRVEIYAVDSDLLATNP